MTNMNVSTIRNKHKFGINMTNPDYYKIKNKIYYEKNKNEIKPTSSIFYYYRNKFGKDLVSDLIISLGCEEALNKLKEMSEIANKNKFMEVYNKKHFSL